MSKKALHRDEFLRHLLWMSVLAAGITLYYYRLYDTVMVGSALFLSGLFFLCMGLFRVVRRLGLFDTTIYGTKRLFGKTKEDFVGWVEQNPYEKNFVELLIVSTAFILISFFILIFTSYLRKNHRIRAASRHGRGGFSIVISRFVLISPEYPGRQDRRKSGRFHRRRSSAGRCAPGAAGYPVSVPKKGSGGR